VRLIRLAVAIAGAVALCAAAPASAAPNRDPARLPAGDYSLDRSHASLVARVSHMGFSRYTLRFTRLDAKFTYDPAQIEQTQVTVSIDPAGIDTGDAGFSRTLATGTGWLNAGAFPKITFVSRAVKTGADGVGQVIGDLTFLGVTRPLTLDVRWNGVGPGVIGGVRTGFSGTAHIKRSDFGNTTYSALVGDDVDFEIEVEFYRT
jgi:polyisoprenoid-binding protein YceI